MAPIGTPVWATAENGVNIVRIECVGVRVQEMDGKSEQSYFGLRAEIEPSTLATPPRQN